MGTLQYERMVSVVIPCYNAGRFLEQSISSCYAQILAPETMEVIVIDDGSTDESLKSLKCLQKKYPIIVKETSKNAGPASARNCGMNVAKGKYIAFLDADDLMKPSRLETQIAFMENNPSIALVMSGIEEVDENGVFIRQVLTPFPHDKTDQIITNFLEGIPSITPTILFRHSILSITGLMDASLRYLEDREFILRVLKEFNIAYLPNCLTVRRLVSGGLSDRVSEDVFLYYRNLFLKKAVELFAFLENYTFDFWAIHYFGLGRLLQKRQQIRLAGKYYLKSLSSRFNFKALLGLMLIFFPASLQSWAARRGLRKV